MIYLRWQFLFILIFFLVAGCAAKKLAIENADTLISYQITKRVPLNSAQKDLLNKDIRDFLEEQRTVAKELLHTLEKLDFKDEKLMEAKYLEIERHYLKIAGEFSQLLSLHLAKLDSKQQEEFFDTLSDENQEILEKKIDDRLDEMEERFKKFFGAVTQKQKELFKRYLPYLAERTKARYARRVELQKQVKEIYQQKISEWERKTRIQEAFASYQTESLIGNRNLELVKIFMPTLIDSQREHFRLVIDEVKDLLRYFLSVDY